MRPSPFQTLIIDLLDGTYVPGDIITAVQGKQVDTIPRLLARLDDFKVGESVNISIIRGSGGYSETSSCKPSDRTQKGKQRLFLTTKFTRY